MTVEENLQMGAFISKNKEETAAAMQDVYEKFPRLRERRSDSWPVRFPEGSSRWWPSDGH